MVKKQAETGVLKAIQSLAGFQNCRLYRNDNGAYQAKNGSWISYGLGRGTSDLIGWRRVRITEEMVGKEIAQFVAIECKMPGNEKKASQEQKNFVDLVNNEGGIACIASSPDKVMEVFDGHGI